MLVLLMVALGVGYLALFAWVMVRQSLWPWTDYGGWHGVLHVVNESDHEVRAGWRWAESERWDGVKQRGRYGVRPHSSEHAILDQPVAGHLWRTPGFAKSIVLRIDGGAFGSIEHAIPVRLRDHMQLRVTPDQRVLFSAGGESWIGYPLLVDEIELTAP